MTIVDETIAIPLWSAVATGAFVFALVVVGALLCARRRLVQRLAGPVLGLGALLAVFVLGSQALDRVTQAQQLSERQALDQRRLDLIHRSDVLNSPLVCLNGLSPAPIESACEQALFATPHAVAQALDYVEAELRLLGDQLAFAKRSDPQYAKAAAGLRRAAENDAYGLFSQVLAVRDGCTPAHCDAFDLLRDTRTIKIHMERQVFATYLARHGEHWAPPRIAAKDEPEEPRAATASSAPPPAKPPAGASAVAVASTIAAPTARAPAAQSVPPSPVAAVTPLPRPAPPERAMQAAVPPATPTASAPVTSAPVASSVPSAPAQPSSETPAAPDHTVRLATSTPDEKPVAAFVPREAHRIVPPSKSVLHDLSFPSAKSIPAISIMQPEPRTPLPSVAATKPPPKPAQPSAASPDPKPQ